MLRDALLRSAPQHEDAERRVGRKGAANAAALPIEGRDGSGTLTSGREAEVQHVAVLDDVVLAFEPELAGVARPRFAVERDVIVVSDGLGADEAFLEIGMDDSRRLLRPRSVRHGPRARFLRAGGEIGDEAEQLVALADEPVEPWLRQAEFGEIG